MNTQPNTRSELERLAEVVANNMPAFWDLIDDAYPKKAERFPKREDVQAVFKGVVCAILQALREPSEGALFDAYQKAKPLIASGETVHAIRVALNAYFDHILTEQDQ